MSDVTSKRNHIYYIDKRGQDKGADAVCSLRLHYHIRKWKSENPPTTSISILDSCVGQNKSQTVMQFFSFLSDCFYDKVFLLFLKSGHSHMFPDRATAHANNAVKHRNISPKRSTCQAASQIISSLSLIKVCALWFERADTPTSEAWSVIMFPTLEECQECLKICSVPSRYLRNYFWQS